MASVHWAFWGVEFTWPCPVSVLAALMYTLASLHRCQIFFNCQASFSTITPSADIMSLIAGPNVQALSSQKTPEEQKPK